MVAFDLETSGFSFRLDDILEIAMVAEDGRSFQISVLTDKPIPKHITKITGITPKENKHNGVSQACAWYRMNSWLLSLGSDITLVGHNILMFDLPFLFHLGNKLGVVNVFQFVDAIDTLTICRDKRVKQLLKQMGCKRLKLGDLHRWCIGEPISSAHRAIYDARANLAVFRSSKFQALFPDGISHTPRDQCYSSYTDRFQRLSKQVPDNGKGVSKYWYYTLLSDAPSSKTWCNFHPLQSAYVRDCGNKEPNKSVVSKA